MILKCPVCGREIGSLPFLRGSRVSDSKYVTPHKENLVHCKICDTVFIEDGTIARYINKISLPVIDPLIQLKSDIEAKKQLEKEKEKQAEDNIGDSIANIVSAYADARLSPSERQQRNFSAFIEEYARVMGQYKKDKRINRVYKKAASKRRKRYG